MEPKAKYTYHVWGEARNKDSGSTILVVSSMHRNGKSPTQLTIPFSPNHPPPDSSGATLGEHREQMLTQGCHDHFIELA